MLIMTRLIFPQWDMITVTLCVFLLSYMYGEGKSNYFKGSILLLSYLVVIMGFFMSGKAGLASIVGMGRFDPPASSSVVSQVRTVGRSKTGMMMAAAAA